MSIIKHFFVWTAFLLSCGCVSAQTIVVYVNGIQVVTQKRAQEQSQSMAQILNDSTNRTGTDKRTFVAEYVYNPIGFYGSTDGCDLCQDMKELFVLKTAEEFYAADFRKILAPHNASSLLAQDAASSIKTAYVDKLTPGSNSLESSGQINDSDLAATKDTVQGILDKLRAFLIDADFYNEGDVYPELLAKPEILSARLEALHAHAGALFQRGITKRLHHALRPRV